MPSLIPSYKDALLTGTRRKTSSMRSRQLLAGRGVFWLLICNPSNNVPFEDRRTLDCSRVSADLLLQLEGFSQAMHQ
jgi:hypothetical protein